MRAPDGGIQPQAAIGANGTIHLIYFKGEPTGGDLFYTKLERGQHTFAQPVRVEGGIPTWSLPTVVVRPDGSFLIIH